MKMKLLKYKTSVAAIALGQEHKITGAKILVVL